MAVRGTLGEEWDSEEVEECRMGAEGPDRAGLWDQLRFHSGKPLGPKGDGWKAAQRGSWNAPWAGELQEKRDRGGCGRSPRFCRAASGTGWISTPALCVPGAARRKSGQLERLMGTGRGRTGLTSATVLVATNIHATCHTPSCVSRNAVGVGELESLRGILGGRDFSSEPTVAPNVNGKTWGGRRMFPQLG